MKDLIDYIHRHSASNEFYSRGVVNDEDGVSDADLLEHLAEGLMEHIKATVPADTDIHHNNEEHRTIGRVSLFAFNEEQLIEFVTKVLEQVEKDRTS